MANKNNQELAVVKGAIPKSLKLQFKVLCVQKELQMSAVLEDLIRQWIQAGAPIPEFYDDLLNEESEDIKGYISKSLKLRFKILCTHKRLKIRFVLYALIQEWVDTVLRQCGCKT
ncbi:hypothetical protein ACE1AT_17185 [Pelatocladus sp. BLCC-F211]|uniref:hypothetical protein n=1 Tax=Pelatocladus sp. BLCC-F211 TaxID=3342752 RepID=UPI0035BB19A8